MLKIIKKVIKIRIIKNLYIFRSNLIIILRKINVIIKNIKEYIIKIVNIYKINK